MSKPIIEVRGISKRYQLGSIGATRLRDDMERFWHRLTGQAEKVDEQEFWALRDVSFEVQPGDIVGIIGRNGAGKSTLLKILSRITEPTSGEVVMRGRVASLLEVGTGFVGDLSGRDNVFLNGAILGMSKAEIRSKFDEIVAFAEIEQFIDTPVKRYSSGMYVRLAFAVAAHLEPEILIIDEVLAVGDAAFQKKCLGKMRDVSSHGRTVLFVSHNMGMINSLCRTAVLLGNGNLMSKGPAGAVVLDYYTRGSAAPNDVTYPEASRPGDDRARLHRAYIADIEGNPVYEIDFRVPFKVVMQFEMLQPAPERPMPNFHFFDTQGDYIFVSQSKNFIGSGTEPGLYEAECLLPAHFLNDGVFFVGVALTFTHRTIHVSFYERDAVSFVIRDPIQETVDQGSRNGYSGPVPGVIRPQLDWKIKALA